MYDDLVHECSVTYDAAEGVYIATSTSRMVGSFNSFDEALEALNGIEVNELQLKVFEVNANGIISRKDSIWCLMNNKLGWRPRVDRSYIYE